MPLRRDCATSIHGDNVTNLTDPPGPCPLMPTDPDSRSVGETWSSKLASSEFSAATFWLALPEVQERIDRKASRGTGHWVNYCVAKFLGSRVPVQRMLSIGCGAGELERHLAALGAFRHCDAWDLAEDGVRRAEEAAAAARLQHISYAVRDIRGRRWPRDRTTRCGSTARSTMSMPWKRFARTWRAA